MLQYHMPGSERILEIPIYRSTQEQHWAEEKQAFESWIEPFEAGFYIGGRTPERAKIWEDYRENAYQRAVTPWDFNQIVGWIRLYAWTGNIRAYLFFVRERVTKVMRRKTFDTKRGNFIEMRVYPEDSNGEISARLKARILTGMAENQRLHRLYVDTGILDTLGPHLDWIALTQSRAHQPLVEKGRFWAGSANAKNRPSN